ncbi:LysR substrate-binding domain-containing protein [Bradyrhizobium sp. GCM10027634]|uniref:LysR substrate-binding domain-containing protein n=1 Tax=unclassified Bradyrhizobium TaxID=2631580 RepID=UPI00188AD1E8|nr:LysR substrate-binding domain-containing protein [Bradyrhizobium sp. WYCCWR 12677]MDN5005618.1 LysR substrate-binding domain-containing protein [Bradyrhizobium sp. WYCCWR 12677]
MSRGQCWKPKRVNIRSRETRWPTFVVGDDLRAGRLVPVLKRFDFGGPPIRAVYPSSRHLSPKVRIFIDAVIDAWRPEPPMSAWAAASPPFQATMAAPSPMNRLR